jgi:hypothetical protein
MPSYAHEALLVLFRNRPTLAPELLRDALHVELLRYTQARIDSADLTDIQPPEYRADLVVLLVDDVPVFGIIVEVQLSRDDRKQYVWPVYVAGLRARLKCPVCLLVVAADESVAKWAAKPVDMGNRNRFVPLVLGPACVPEITDEEQASLDPELAVLSAMAHGHDDDADKAARIAAAAKLAIRKLDDDRVPLYFDLVEKYLSEAAHRAFQTMKSANYEYQSDFARRYMAQGRAEGSRDALINLITRLLDQRFGALSDESRAYIAAASIDDLNAIGERLLTARTLQEALGEH